MGEEKAEASHPSTQGCEEDWGRQERYCRWVLTPGQLQDRPSTLAGQAIGLLDSFGIPPRSRASQGLD